MTEIVLNVKGIIAKLYCEGVKTVHIEAAGECKVCLLYTSSPEEVARIRGKSVEEIVG